MRRTDKGPPKLSQIGPPNAQKIAIYLRLLDAEQDEAGWKEAAEIILGLDVNSNPRKARLAYDNARKHALWLRDHGFLTLARKANDYP